MNENKPRNVGKGVESEIKSLKPRKGNSERNSLLLRSSPQNNSNYIKRYNDLDEKIRKHVLKKFNDEMNDLKVCVIMSPIKLGEAIMKVQKETIDWYEKNNE